MAYRLTMKNNVKRYDSNHSSIVLNGAVIGGIITLGNGRYGITDDKDKIISKGHDGMGYALKSDALKAFTKAYFYG